MEIKYIGERIYSNGNIKIKKDTILVVGIDIDEKTANYLLKTFPQWFKVVGDVIKVEKKLENIGEDKMMTDKKVKKGRKKSKKVNKKEDK